MMTMLCRIVALLFITSFLSCCASTSLVDTWRNPQLTAPRLHKLLVVRVSGHDGNRKLYEDVLVSELQKRGVDAVPGHLLIPEDKMQDWQTVEGAMQKSQAHAVLTMQTVQVEEHATVEPGYPSTYPGYWYPSVFSAWDLRGFYGSALYHEPAMISTYQVASIQANLFDAKSGRLIWAATMKTSEPEKTVPVSKDLARIVVRAMAKEGLI